MMNDVSSSEVGVETLVNNDEGNVNDGSSETVRSSPTSQDISMPSKTGFTQQQQATEIVKTLFGDVGKVVGIFSCSVTRQSGRLYVSAQGLFFYSNLFGFEKKISIRYEDMQKCIRYRSTSIYVQTSTDEHVLKSFTDRDSVYTVISEYFQIDQVTNPPTVPERNEDEALNSVSATNTDEVSDVLGLRTASDNSIRTSVSDADGARVIESEISAVDKDTIWDAIKNLSRDWDSSVKNLKLPLAKASIFYDLFLADNAPNSLKTYHEKMMGDKNVSVGIWVRDDASASAANSDQSFSRTIRFEHKSKVSIAHVTRNQTFRVYGERACMKNITHISGVPSSDCFFVEDFWTIEKEGECIILNVKFRITFSKSTFLKSIIESRTRTETIEWYSKYTSFIRDTIEGTSKEFILDESLPVTGIPSNAPSANDQTMRLLFVLCFVVTAAYVYSLRLRMVQLEHALSGLQSRLLEVENQCLLGT